MWKHLRYSTHFGHRGGNFAPETCCQTQHEHTLVQARAWCGAMQSLCQVKRGDLPLFQKGRPAWHSALCYFHPAVHPGNIWAVYSISFYAADLKTWLPINSLQLSFHTHISSCCSTLSRNLLLPCHHKIQKPCWFFF